MSSRASASPTTGSQHRPDDGQDHVHEPEEQTPGPSIRPPEPEPNAAGSSPVEAAQARANPTQTDPLVPTSPHDGRAVKVTGYRLMVTVVTLVLGSVKAAASYEGQSVTTSTLDWVIGIVLAILCVPSWLEGAISPS